MRFYHEWLGRIGSLLLILGGVLLSSGCDSTDKTEDWFEGGDMKPASADTLQLTARILAAKGQTQQAGFVLDRMLDEYPDRIATYTEGASVLLVEGRVADAEVLLNQGLKVFPGNPILLNDRGMVRLLSGNLYTASEDFDAALEADPVDADFVANAALGAALKGDEARAIELWSRVLPSEEVNRNLAIAREARSRFLPRP
ncbi:MAG: hypothetical protein QMB94_02595 [Phycisphaerales bacterium]